MTVRQVEKEPWVMSVGDMSSVVFLIFIAYWTRVLPFVTPTLKRCFWVLGLFVMEVVSLPDLSVGPWHSRGEVRILDA